MSNAQQSTRGFNPGDALPDDDYFSASSVGYDFSSVDIEGNVYGTWLNEAGKPKDDWFTNWSRFSDDQDAQDKVTTALTGILGRAPTLGEIDDFLYNKPIYAPERDKEWTTDPAFRKTYDDSGEDGGAGEIDLPGVSAEEQQSLADTFPDWTIYIDSNGDKRYLNQAWKDAGWAGHDYLATDDHLRHILAEHFANEERGWLPAPIDAPAWPTTGPGWTVGEDGFNFDALGYLNLEWDSAKGTYRYEIDNDNDWVEYGEISHEDLPWAEAAEAAVPKDEPENSRFGKVSDEWVARTDTNMGHGLDFDAIGYTNLQWDATRGLYTYEVDDGDGVRIEEIAYADVPFEEAYTAWKEGSSYSAITITDVHPDWGVYTDYTDDWERLGLKGLQYNEETGLYSYFDTTTNTPNDNVNPEDLPWDELTSAEDFVEDTVEEEEPQPFYIVRDGQLVLATAENWDDAEAYAVEGLGTYNEEDGSWNYEGYTDWEHNKRFFSDEQLEILTIDHTGIRYKDQNFISALAENFFPLGKYGEHPRSVFAQLNSGPVGFVGRASAPGQSIPPGVLAKIDRPDWQNSLTRDEYGYLVKWWKEVFVPAVRERQNLSSQSYTESSGAAGGTAASASASGSGSFLPGIQLQGDDGDGSFFNDPTLFFGQMEAANAPLEMLVGNLNEVLLGVSAWDSPITQENIGTLNTQLGLARSYVENMTKFSEDLDDVGIFDSISLIETALTDLLEGKVTTSTGYGTDVEVREVPSLDVIEQSLSSINDNLVTAGVDLASLSGELEDVSTRVGVIATDVSAIGFTTAFMDDLGDAEGYVDTLMPLFDAIVPENLEGVTETLASMVLEGSDLNQVVAGLREMNVDQEVIDNITVALVDVKAVNTALMSLAGYEDENGDPIPGLGSEFFLEVAGLLAEPTDTTQEGVLAEVIRLTGELEIPSDVYDSFTKTATGLNKVVVAIDALGNSTQLADLGVSIDDLLTLKVLNFGEEGYDDSLPSHITQYASPLRELEAAILALPASAEGLKDDILYNISQVELLSGLLNGLGVPASLGVAITDMMNFTDYPTGVTEGLTPDDIVFNSTLDELHYRIQDLDLGELEDDILSSISEIAQLEETLAEFGLDDLITEIADLIDPTNEDSMLTGLGNKLAGLNLGTEDDPGLIQSIGRALDEALLLEGHVGTLEAFMGTSAQISAGKVLVEGTGFIGDLETANAKIGEIQTLFEELGLGSILLEIGDPGEELFDENGDPIGFAPKTGLFGSVDLLSTAFNNITGLSTGLNADILKLLSDPEYVVQGEVSPLLELQTAIGDVDINVVLDGILAASASVGLLNTAIAGFMGTEEEPGPLRDLGFDLNALLSDAVDEKGIKISTFGQLKDEISKLGLPEGFSQGILDSIDGASQINTVMGLLQGSLGGFSDVLNILLDEDTMEPAGKVVIDDAGNERWMPDEQIKSPLFRLKEKVLEATDLGDFQQEILDTIGDVELLSGLIEGIDLDVLNPNLMFNLTSLIGDGTEGSSGIIGSMIDDLSALDFERDVDGNLIITEQISAFYGTEDAPGPLQLLINTLRDDIVFDNTGLNASIGVTADLLSDLQDSLGGLIFDPTPAGKLDIGLSVTDKILNMLKEDSPLNLLRGELSGIGTYLSDDIEIDIGLLRDRTTEVTDILDALDLDQVLENRISDLLDLTTDPGKDLNELKQALDAANVALDSDLEQRISDLLTSSAALNAQLSAAKLAPKSELEDRLNTLLVQGGDLEELVELLGELDLDDELERSISARFGQVTQLNEALQLLASDGHGIDPALETDIRTNIGLILGEIEVDEQGNVISETKGLLQLLDEMLPIPSEIKSALESNLTFVQSLDNTLNLLEQRGFAVTEEIRTQLVSLKDVIEGVDGEGGLENALNELNVSDTFRVELRGALHDTSVINSFLDSLEDALPPEFRETLETIMSQLYSTDVDELGLIQQLRSLQFPIEVAQDIATVLADLSQMTQIFTESGLSATFVDSVQTALNEGLTLQDALTSLQVPMETIQSISTQIDEVEGLRESLEEMPGLIEDIKISDNVLNKLDAINAAALLAGGTLEDFSKAILGDEEVIGLLDETRKKLFETTAEITGEITDVEAELTEFEATVKRVGESVDEMRRFLDQLSNPELSPDLWRLLSRPQTGDLEDTVQVALRSIVHDLYPEIGGEATRIDQFRAAQTALIEQRFIQSTLEVSRLFEITPEGFKSGRGQISYEILESAKNEQLLQMEIAAISREDALRLDTLTRLTETFKTISESTLGQQTLAEQQNQFSQQLLQMQAQFEDSLAQQKFEFNRDITQQVSELAQSAAHFTESMNARSYEFGEQSRLAQSQFEQSVTEFEESIQQKIDEWGDQYDLAVLEHGVNADETRQIIKNMQADILQQANELQASMDEFNRSLHEEQRQFDESMSLAKSELAENSSQFASNLAETMRQFDDELIQDQNQFDAQFQQRATQMVDEMTRFREQLDEQSDQFDSTMLQKANELKAAIDQFDQSIALEESMTVAEVAALKQRVINEGRQLSAQITQFNADLAERRRQFNAEELMKRYFFNTEQANALFQFNESIRVRSEEWADEHDLDEQQIEAAIRQIDNQIMVNTRKLTAEISQNWAAITGRAGTITGDLTLNDLGLNYDQLVADVESTEGSKQDAIWIDQDVRNAVKLAFRDVMGREATREEIDALTDYNGTRRLTGVEGVPTQEAKEFAAQVMMQNLERTAKYDQLANELELDQETFDESVRQAHQQWSVFIGDVSSQIGLDPVDEDGEPTNTEASDKFKLLKFSLDNKITSLTLITGLTAEERTKAISKALDDAANEFATTGYGPAGEKVDGVWVPAPGRGAPIIDEALKVKFLEASDLFDRQYGESIRELARQRGMDAERFELGMKQAQIQEEQTMSMWYSYMESVVDPGDALQLNFKDDIESAEGFFNSESSFGKVITGILSDALDEENLSKEDLVSFITEDFVSVDDYLFKLRRTDEASFLVLNDAINTLMPSKYQLMFTPDQAETFLASWVKAALLGKEGFLTENEQSEMTRVEEVLATHDGSTPEHYDNLKREILRLRTMAMEEEGGDTIEARDRNNYPTEEDYIEGYLFGGPGLPGVFQIGSLWDQNVGSAMNTLLILGSKISDLTVIGTPRDWIGRLDKDSDGKPMASKMRETLFAMVNGGNVSPERERESGSGISAMIASGLGQAVGVLIGSM